MNKHTDDAIKLQDEIQRLVVEFESKHGIKIQIGIDRHNSYGDTHPTNVWVLPKDNDQVGRYLRRAIELYND